MKRLKVRGLLLLPPRLVGGGWWGALASWLPFGWEMSREEEGGFLRSLSKSICLDRKKKTKKNKKNN